MTIINLRDFYYWYTQDEYNVIGKEEQWHEQKTEGISRL